MTSVSPVAALREIGFLLERTRSETHRVKAYRNAADIVAAMSESERQQHTEQRTWGTVRGIGPKTAIVISQALSGAVPEYLQRLRDEKEPLVEGGLTMRAAVQGDLEAEGLRDREVGDRLQRGDQQLSALEDFGLRPT